MRTLKDKKRFGWGKIPKNHACKKFGIGDGKEWRKQRRRRIKNIKHKLLKCIPLTPEEESSEIYYWYFRKTL